MSEVETTAANGQGAGAPASTTPPAVPATPSAAPDVETAVRQRLEEERRKWQSIKDQETARLHRQHQEETRALREAAQARLSQLGDHEADSFGADVEVHQKARQWDEAQSLAQQWQAWNGYVASVAQAHGLKSDDPRLAGANSAEELVAKAQAAMRTDAEAERERLLKAEKRAAVDQRVAAGDLDTLTGAPAATVDKNARIQAIYSRLADTQREPSQHAEERAALRKELKALQAG